MCFRPAISDIANVKVCPECKHRNSADLTLCEKCGSELPMYASYDDGPPGTPTAPTAPGSSGAPGAPKAPKAPGK